MLAAGYLRNRLGGRRRAEAKALDTRQAAAVVEAAAARIGVGREATAPVAAALETHGVKYAWQLEHSNASHWASFNASFGLEMAIMAELQSPTASGSMAPKTLARSASQAKLQRQRSSNALARDSELPDRLRRFLLMPGPNGEEPAPLGEPGALFLSMLTTPPEGRQNLYLMICELLALIAGLMIPIPLEMLRQRTAAAQEQQGWTLAPSWTTASFSDGIDALAFWIFVMLVHVVFYAVVNALFIGASGCEASAQYYQFQTSILSTVLIWFMFGAFLPLNVLVGWALAAEATSVYPLLAAVPLIVVMNVPLQTMVMKFLISEMPLELYHLPSWMLGFMRSQMGPIPSVAKQMSREALKPAAVERAVQLRLRAGVDGPREDLGAFEV